MKMQPTYDRVIVKVAQVEEKSSSGFFLPGDPKETTVTGEVLAVGPGAKTKDGVLLPMTLKVGDHIMFLKNAGHKVKSDGNEFTILTEADAVAIIA